MSKFETFIHNDITWCANTDCEHTACFRHMNNRIPEEGCNIFSMSFFKNTKDCPYDLEEIEKLKSFKEEMLNIRAMSPEEKKDYLNKRWN